MSERGGRAHWIFVAVLLAAVLVRGVLFFGGVRGSDAYVYARLAYQIAAGRYDPVAETGGLELAGQARADASTNIAFALASLRYAVLVPTAVVYRLFGVGDVTSALVPMAASLATIGIVFVSGSRLWDPATGMLAAVLLAVYPLSIMSASLLGPDSFLPLLSGGSYALAALVGIPARVSGRSWAGSVAAFGAGCLIGVATMAREVGLLLLVPLAFLLGLWRQWLLMLPLGLGLATSVAAEMLYLWVATDEPLYRFRVARLFTELLRTPEAFGITDPSYYLRGMVGLDLSGLARYGFLFYLVPVGILVGWRRRPAVTAPLAFWLLFFLLYLSIGSATLGRFTPLVKSFGYLSIITVPAALLAAFALRPLWGQRPWTLALLLVFLCAASLYGAFRVLEKVRDDARPYEVVASLLERDRGRPVYVHHARWELFLQYHLRESPGFRVDRSGAPGQSRIRSVLGIPEPDGIRDAYVVIHRRYLFYDIHGHFVGRLRDLPGYLFAPPANWKAIVREEARPAYNSFTLYYAPPTSTQSPRGRARGPS